MTAGNAWRNPRFKRGFGLIVVSLLVYAATPSIHAGPDDDREEREFARATARRAVVENCQICHSEDLIITQRLSPAQWKAEVDKMVGWGAPLPRDDHAKVIAYLAEEYSLNAPRKPLERITLEEAAAPERPETATLRRGNVAAGQARFNTDCANCHGKDGQGDDLGPNLVEKPVLYRPTEFQKVVKDGRGRMPGSKDLIDEKTNINIIEWLRSLRYTPIH